MPKATKRSRPGCRLDRKDKAWFPLRRPALLAALGLAGWAPAGAGAFPASIELSSLDGTKGFRITGAAPGDRSGFAVRGAGDVNGDAIADLLIGAYGADPNGNRSGSSHVVFGRALPASFPANLDLSTLNGTNGFRLNGVAAGDRSGRAVSDAGDVNGDGVADLLIGAPGADPNGYSSGASYVVFGRNTAQAGPFPASLDLSSLDGTNGFRLNGVAGGDRSGRAVSSAGDVNGDGLADLLIGAPYADPNGGAGASYVVFRRNTARTGPFPASLDLSDLDGTNGFRLNGVAPFNRSGRAVSSAGDVNGDGLADLLIGAPYADPNGFNSGASNVVFGRDTAQTGPFPPSLELSNLDGTNGFRLNGVAAGDYSGFAVSSAGDVNGDGLADLLIGTFAADPNGTSSGTSYVVFGRNTARTDPFPASLNLSSLNGTNGFRLNGVAADDRLGIAVSSAGDVNGDGLADLLIGALGADPNGEFSGASYVVFGRNTAQTGPFPASLNVSGLDGTNGFRLNGFVAYDNSGYAVSSAGDVNGDGIADLLIGAPGAPNRSAPGASYVVFGRNTAQTGPFPASLNLSVLNGTNGFRLAGVAAGDYSGRAVSSAGDVNGDGLADLLIGALGADPNGESSGASYVVFGEPPPPAPLPPPPSPRTCNGLPVTIQGTDDGETLVGTSGNDVIDGQGGNDVLRGLGGNDVLCGGDGRDRLFGRPGPRPAVRPERPRCAERRHGSRPVRRRRRHRHRSWL